MKQFLRGVRDRLMLMSLRAAAREQGLAPVAAKLEAAVPDIKQQYTSFDVDSEYLRTKVRTQHAFQISLAAAELEKRPGCVVVDIGDSSGSHIAYLKALNPSGGQRYLSVNLDPTAIEKIKSRGLEGVLARAEELDKHGINADVFLLYETMEHFSDPVTFLHELSSKTKCQRLVLTVPYVRKTRMGLHHVRAGLRKPLTAESVHIWELSPEDLRLLFKHSGWKLEREWIYRQYPRFHPLRLTSWIWRRWDFEGFYGAVLSRDDSWSSLYQSWR